MYRMLLWIIYVDLFFGVLRFSDKFSQVALDPLFLSILEDLLGRLLRSVSVQLGKVFSSRATCRIHSMRLGEPAIIQEAALAVLAMVAEGAIQISTSRPVWT